MQPSPEKNPMEAHGPGLMDRPPRPRPATCAPACPACGAAFAPHRGELQCVRCRFTLCVGCDPCGGADDPDRSDPAD